ncbi:MAG: lysophospholipid acyltransferase family protein [Marinilabilia sp.]
MIRASHHPFFVWFFRHYSRLMIHHHFRKISIEGDIQAPEKSLLVVSNHFSWWDGFFINYLNHRLWQKKFHAMMLEDQLESRKFLSRAGCFSIRRERSATRESFQYAQNLLQKPENLLLMYPQGELCSQHERPLHFEPGALHLFNTTGASMKMVVVLTDYFSFRKPSVAFYIKDYNREDKDQKSLEKAFNDFLDACIDSQNKKAGQNI